ncbi:DUF3015 domain-containing protein [Helicobacter sp. MIT 03-1614]|jgi:hypothetical protein|uniref:DUF3015 domain-containing protein n=1 Tax=Helicobacter hepaticus (strain ATCC 51449 / 3B1) TaxID=235279 RepID=Q7VJA4_HELHP|nr:MULTISPECIES: DUF3015 family protein [Helicobacter]AAP76936.1 conserved hypothetical protein [Helicobacter hepaticus ATCC 51449]TLD87447.1 DUF3015 domain-containing protein [Helicobacter sp. MIT 03-1614]
MKKVFMSVALSASLVSGAFAAANSNTGCGLGSYLIDKQGLIWNLFQITTNGSTGTQTFGITSGTSGCKSGKIAMDSRTQEFVAANMDALSQEIAQGRGEHLDTLVELLNVADKDAFKIALQDNYNKLYASKDAQSADVLDGAATL